MASAADARAKERTRVKSGIMNGLGRLLLYRDKAEKVEGNSTVEATHWSQVPLRSLEYVPPGVEAGVRLTKNMRKSRALFKAKQQAPFKAFVFARIEEGVTTDVLQDVFNTQIWQGFADKMAGKPNNAKNRSLAYCELVRMYPEGVFKGFSFPNLSKKEDYTLQILSGKRGETASISVAESENGNSDEEELELGSDAGSDEEVINAGAQSESLIPATQFLTTSVNHRGNPESTPRKKKSSTAAASAVPCTSTQAAGASPPDVGSLFSTGSSQDLCGNSPTASVTPPSTSAAKAKSPRRPPLRLNTPPAPPIPASTMAAVAKIYGVKSPRRKETAQKQQISTEELMRDPFAGVKPGFPTSKDHGTKRKRSLGPALDREGKNKGKGLRGRKRARADSEDGDSNMLVRLEDVGNSSDEFVQEESDSSPGKGTRKKRSAITLDDMANTRKSKHRCHDSCTCVELDRGTLRKRLSTTEENHMRENLRYLDFRQILKGFTDMKHHLNRLEKKIDTMDHRQETVNELAEKVVGTHQAESALKDERGSIGAPWGTVEEIEEGLEKPENEVIAYRLLKTVSQDKTHFPREAVRLLLRSNLRHRVYYSKPGKNDDKIIRYGQEYVVYPDCFHDLIINYMSEQVAGLKGLEAAKEKWTDHFNDTRKKAKNDILATFRKPENKDNELFALVYKDTEAKLYRIKEEAPLKPPKKEEDMPAYEAQKEDYIRRWKPIVDAAYEKAKKRGSSPMSCIEQGDRDRWQAD